MSWVPRTLHSAWLMGHAPLTLFHFKTYLFIYLAVLGLICGIPRPGIKPRPLALGAWSLSHWTTKEGLPVHFKCTNIPFINKVLGHNLLWGGRVKVMNMSCVKVYAEFCTLISGVY